MIVYLYATRNKKSGAYSKVTGEALEKERATESYARAAMEASDESKLLLQELELYFLGTYDDKTGSICPVMPEFLLDLGSVIHGGESKEASE